MSFVNAKRIWINDAPKPEEYGYFKESFDFSGVSVFLKILAETDYIAYVNGERAAFLQFAGCFGKDGSRANRKAQPAVHKFLPATLSIPCHQQRNAHSSVREWITRNTEITGWIKINI